MIVFEKYLTRAEEAQLMKTVRAYGDVLARRDAAWMAALRHTGARIGAWAALDVRHARGVIATYYLELEAANAKRGVGGRIYVGAAGRRAFGTLLRIQREMGGVGAPDEPLVLSRKRRRMSIRSYQARMAHWLTAAGLGEQVHVGPHGWRHTLAKRIVDTHEGSDPAAIVQRALLHRNIRSAGVYMAPDRECYERAMEGAR